MEGKKDITRHYNALVWLLLTEYEKDKGYTPSDYILQSTRPKIETSSSGLPLQIIDGSLYDFTIASGFKDYLDLFLDTTYKFENALVILSYTKEKYIVRDYYLAGLAKSYTCWDTVYINCPTKEKIDTSIFDFIVAPEELPDKLTKVIQNG